jgi:hypothetical protein
MRAMEFYVQVGGLNLRSDLWYDRTHPTFEAAWVDLQAQRRIHLGPDRAGWRLVESLPGIASAYDSCAIYVRVDDPTNYLCMRFGAIEDREETSLLDMLEEGA